MKLKIEKRIFKWMIPFVLLVLPFVYIAFIQNTPSIKQFTDENFILSLVITFILIYVVNKFMEGWEHKLFLKSLDEKHQKDNIENEFQPK